MPRYRFREGYRVGGLNADETYEALEAIRAQHPDGDLNPETVVTVASDPNSVLHDAFEWRDSVAARRYRLQQAYTLVRSVYVDRELDPPLPAAPVYVRIQPHVYQPVERVVQRMDQFEAALGYLHQKLAGAERAVRDLERAAQVGTDPDRAAKVALAVAAFDTVKEALVILK